MQRWKVSKKIEKAPIAPDTEIWTNLNDNTLSQKQHGPETVSAQPSDLPLPGILTIRLFEGVGLSVPDLTMELLEDRQRANLAQTVGTEESRMNDSSPLQYRPYAILDFDKSQAVIQSYTASIQNPLWSANSGTQKFDVFRAAEMTIYIYVKIPGDNGLGVCLGSGKVMPSVTMTKFSIKWLHLTGGTGKIGLGLEYTKISGTPTLSDFDLKTIIGETESGGVYLARRRDTGRSFAVKLVRKSRVHSWSNVAHGLRFDIDNSFIAPLYITLQEHQQFCLISPFASGGHLFHHLQRERRFDTVKARFYAAELTCALEYLHDLDIVCQGLKPGDILLDSWGHVVVADFSLHQSKTQAELYGTTALLEYPAPELLMGHAHTKTVDWWTLGVFLYEMVTGMPPFYAQSTEETHHNISIRTLHIPETLDLETRDLLFEILNRDPKLRLGANGACEVKNHAFFSEIDWQILPRRQLGPPFIPPEVAMFFKQHNHLPPKPVSLPLVRLDKWTWNDFLEDDEHLKKFCTPSHSSRLVQASDGSLIHAVIKGDHDLARALVKEVQINDRVSATKALGLAVEQRDKAMIRILLDSGVHCDFRDSDRPAHPTYQDGCTFGEKVGDITEPPEFIPPLVRAVKLSDIDLVKTLLASGADANAGFHDSTFDIHEPRDDTLQHPISCGRAVQLAMALGHDEIVQLLLDSEVNIDIPAPVWEHHNCKPIERSSYLRITSLLRQMVEKHSSH